MNHIQIEEIQAQVEALKKERDAYKGELENIANASMKKWEMNSDEFLSEFQAWAQTRARHALSKATSQAMRSPDAVVACATCHHWEPGGDPTLANGYCPVFDKTTNEYGGKRCTAWENA